ncbi:MAG TPA: hypothetical protein VFC56_01135 [Stellaceae bacterium]|nr:hypothetical protein [Stellaceae bacterium]
MPLALATGFDGAGKAPYGVGRLQHMTGDCVVSARVLLVGLMALCAAAGAASACQKTSNPQLDENFKNADPGWGQPDNIAAFTADGLVLKPPVSGSAWRSNAHFTMARADWCITVVNPANLPDPANEDTVGSAGVWFWGKDQQNFYTATISLDGKAAIDRLNRGGWQIVAAPAATPAVKTAPGAANELEIVTEGDKAIFYVNGTRVAATTGRPPANGGSPGLYGESGPKGTSWVFPRATLY